MKRVLKLSGLIITAYILLIKTGFLSAMALFFLVGSVPGTDYVLSPVSTILATLVTVAGVSGCINQNFGRALLAFMFRSNLASRQSPPRRHLSIKLQA